MKGSTMEQHVHKLKSSIVSLRVPASTLTSCASLLSSGHQFCYWLKQQSEGIVRIKCVNTHKTFRVVLRKHWMLFLLIRVCDKVTTWMILFHHLAIWAYFTFLSNCLLTRHKIRTPGCKSQFCYSTHTAWWQRTWCLIPLNSESFIPTYKF